MFFMADTEVPEDFYYYYWSAPTHYTGNKLTSYDLSLRITVSWSVMRGDTSGKAIFNPDVILVVRIDFKFHIRTAVAASSCMAALHNP